MARGYLWACVAVFFALAIALLVSPAQVLAKVDLQFDTPTAFADIRADYGGCILGLSVFMAWCAASVDRVRMGLLCCGLTLSGYAAGRVYSLLVDGMPKRVIFILLAFEVVGAIGCFLMMKHANPRGTQILSGETK